MLSETNRIDIIAESKQGEIILAISAHEDWKKNPHTLKQLDGKLHAYITYIENGQFSQKFGNKPVIIQIMTAHPLSPEATQLVEKVQNATGYEIKVEVMGLFSPFKK